MAICEKCGHSNDDNVKFCGGCGEDGQHLLLLCSTLNLMRNRLNNQSANIEDLYLHPTSHVPPHSRQSPSQRRNMLSPIAVQALCRSRVCTRGA